MSVPLKQAAEVEVAESDRIRKRTEDAGAKFTVVLPRFEADLI